MTQDYQSCHICGKEMPQSGCTNEMCASICKIDGGIHNDEINYLNRADTGAILHTLDDKTQGKLDRLIEAIEDLTKAVEDLRITNEVPK